MDGKELEQEIASMNELDLATVAPSTDPPSETDPPETEAPGTEAPSTEAPSTEAPSTESPSTEAPTTEAPDETQLYREELERTLRAKAEEEAKKAGSEEPPTPATKHPSTEPPFDPTAEIDFLGDEDLDDVTGDREKFNSLLNRVYKAGVGAGTRLGSEKVLRSIPEIVKKNVQAQTSIQKAREKFFSENEDLAPYPQVIADSFNQAANENPDATMEDLLKKTEEISRQRLNLHRKVMIDQSKATQKKPTFEKTPKGKKSSKKGQLTGLAKEIQDMIDSI